MCSFNPARSKYHSLWERLVANSEEPTHDNGCWPWKGKTRCRYGYGRFNFWVPGLQRRMTLSAHVAMFVLAEAAPETPDDFYLAYLEVRRCGLEVEHGCDNEPCINPEHLRLMTHSENCARKYERKDA